MTTAERIEAAANLIEEKAHTALTEYGTGDGGSRRVALQHLVTGATQPSTAQIAAGESGEGFSDRDELDAAHQLIAELALRLAERDGRSLS